MNPGQLEAIGMLLDIAEEVAECIASSNSAGMDGWYECPFQCGASEHEGTAEELTHRPGCPITRATALGFAAPYHVVDIEINPDLHGHIQAAVNEWREACARELA